MTALTSQAARTQAARRSYYAAVADNNTFRIERASQALKISEGMLLAAAGHNPIIARAAEAAYVSASNNEDTPRKLIETDHCEVNGEIISIRNRYNR